MLSSKLFALNRWHASHDYLDQRYFLLTLLAAVLLHIGGIFVWSMMPKVEVVEVPVHALNIKLSDSDEMTRRRNESPSSRARVTALRLRVRCRGWCAMIRMMMTRRASNR